MARRDPHVSELNAYEGALRHVKKMIGASLGLVYCAWKGLGMILEGGPGDALRSVVIPAGHEGSEKGVKLTLVWKAQRLGRSTRGRLQIWDADLYHGSASMWPLLELRHMRFELSGEQSPCTS